MWLNELYLQNVLWITLAISVVIIVLSAVLSIRTGRWYLLSSVRGIRHVSIAFGSFALGYMVLLISSIYPVHYTFHMAYEYLLSLFGYYLVFSLVYKEHKNIRQYYLHGAALFIAVFDVLFGYYYIYFIMQLAVIAYGGLITYVNYTDSKTAKQRSMRELYFIAMVLAFVGWGANFLSGFISPVFPVFSFYAQIITLAIFLIFFFVVFGGKRWLASGSA